MEKFKRNHLLHVFDDIISNFIKVIFPIAVLIFGNRESLWVMLLLPLVLIGVMIFSVVKWFKNVYYVKDNFIVVRQGIFVVKTREVPFNKIETINVSQGIRQRIFRIATLKIDTGNSSLGDSEIQVVIGKVEAELLREEIMNSRDLSPAQDREGAPLQHKEQQDVPQFSISHKELLVVGITSNAVFAGLAFIGSIYTILNDYLSNLLDNILMEWGIFEYLFDFKSKSMSAIIIIIATILVFFIIFSFIASILGTYIKYYGFNVRREGKNIIINYGLLEKKNYVLPIAKIKAVYIKQNLLRQVFGLSAINVESIGYGNEKGEEAILYPIAGRDKRSLIIKELVPEYVFEEELSRVPKKALRRFMISSSLLPFLLSMTLTVAFSYGYLSLFLLPFFVLKGLLEYKNSAVGTNGRLLCLCNKAFTKSITLVTVEDIQSSAESSSYFQRRKRLFNYEISIHSNVFGKVIRVKNLDESLRDGLLNITV